MPKEIILKAFEQWVKGLGPKDARITVFSRIRDIPYYLVPQIADPNEWAASILHNCKASCSPKHYLLGLLFGKLGIPIKYATYSFKWDKQPIDYPAELKKLAQGSPVSYHVACKAHINDKWILVDATWDTALKKAGFAVNGHWDGESDTLNAVMPIEEVIHDSLEGRLDYVTEKKKLFSDEEKKTYGEFIEKFNLWLETLRQK
jgi:hypothetical protein